MFKNILKQFGSILVTLLSLQTVCSALVVEKNQTLSQAEKSETTALEVRTSDEYTIVHKWSGGAIIGSATAVGVLITSVAAVFVTWYVNQPDASKICGKTAVVDITGSDGVAYQYYVYSYTTGSNCDTTQRAKTITDSLSNAFNELHSDSASAVCIDFDHHGTWHGVLGLATASSGIDPQKACSGHHNGAKRSVEGLPQLEEMVSTKASEVGLVKRASISVSKSAEKSGTTKFSAPNKSQGVILQIAGQMYQQSQLGSCEAVTGTLEDTDGVSYSYYYYASGRNCDTTAEIKTMVTALDNAWEDLGSTSALCMTMQHGSGTWRGHLGISVMQSTYPAQKLC
ncbi:uncharacterized protein N7511_011090 [Penicillium nucicola]|uniref:uncharacterized protein n=1 Tax=Penicillium nucicola TaxID=1850975 RepID=UPI00254533C0|nr:uncharacterized protein N7511_011090 [Penicillium nucicola]KAJ5742689.1 hypothetical protein N7511_011090 [Penicillium nucicola]